MRKIRAIQFVLSLTLLVQLALWIFLPKQAKTSSSHAASNEPVETDAAKSEQTEVSEQSTLAATPPPVASIAKRREDFAAKLLESGYLAKQTRIRLIMPGRGGLNPLIPEILDLDAHQTREFEDAKDELIANLAEIRSSHASVEQVSSNSLLVTVTPYREEGYHAYDTFKARVADIVGAPKADAFFLLTDPSIKREFYDFGGMETGYQLSAENRHMPNDPTPSGRLYSLNTIYEAEYTRGYNSGSGTLESFSEGRPAVMHLFPAELLEAISSQEPTP